MVDRKAIKRLSTLAIVFTGANESRETFSQLPFARELLRISFDLPSDWFSVPNEQMHWTARPSREPSSYATLPSNWFVQFLTSLSLFQPSATRAAAASHGTKRDLLLRNPCQTSVIQSRTNSDLWDGYVPRGDLPKYSLLKFTLAAQKRLANF